MNGHATGDVGREKSFIPKRRGNGAHGPVMRSQVPNLFKTRITSHVRIDHGHPDGDRPFFRTDHDGPVADEIGKGGDGRAGGIHPHQPRALDVLNVPIQQPAVLRTAQQGFPQVVQKQHGQRLHALINDLGLKEFRFRFQRKQPLRLRFLHLGKEQAARPGQDGGDGSTVRLPVGKSRNGLTRRGGLKRLTRSHHRFGFSYVVFERDSKRDVQGHDSTDSRPESIDVVFPRRAGQRGNFPGLEVRHGLERYRRAGGKPIERNVAVSKYVSHFPVFIDPHTDVFQRSFPACVDVHGSPLAPGSGVKQRSHFDKQVGKNTEDAKNGRPSAKGNHPSCSMVGPTPQRPGGYLRRERRRRGRCRLDLICCGISLVHEEIVDA